MFPRAGLPSRGRRHPPVRTHCKPRNDVFRPCPADPGSRGSVNRQPTTCLARPGGFGVIPPIVGRLRAGRCVARRWGDPKSLRVAIVTSTSQMTVEYRLRGHRSIVANESLLPQSSFGRIHPGPSETIASRFAGKAYYAVGVCRLRHSLQAGFVPWSFPVSAGHGHDIGRSTQSADGDRKGPFRLSREFVTRDASSPRRSPGVTTVRRSRCRPS